MKLLVEKAQRGDGDAFAKVILLIQPSLYRVARAYLSSDEDIADAIQEAILKGWGNLAKLQHPEYFKTWMIKILINEALKIRKGLGQEVSLNQELYSEEGEGEEILAEEISRREEWQPGYGLDFEDMMRVLAEPIREVFVLYYAEGYSTGEIAAILHSSEGAVRQRLSRGRKVIRDTYFGKGH